MEARVVGAGGHRQAQVVGLAFSIAGGHGAAEVCFCQRSSYLRVACKGLPCVDGLIEAPGLKMAQTDLPHVRSCRCGASSLPRIGARSLFMHMLLNYPLAYALLYHAIM